MSCQDDPPRSKSSIYRHDLEFARMLQEEYEKAEQADDPNSGEFYGTLHQLSEDDEYLAKRLEMEEADLRLAAEMQARPSCVGALKPNSDDEALARLISSESEVVDYDEDLARRLALEEHDRELAAEVYTRGSHVLRPNQGGFGGLGSLETASHDEDMLLAMQLTEELQVQETPQGPFVQSINAPAPYRQNHTRVPAQQRSNRVAARREIPEDRHRYNTHRNVICDNVITAECTAVQSNQSDTVSTSVSQDRNKQAAQPTRKSDLGMDQFDEPLSLLPVPENDNKKKK